MFDSVPPNLPVEPITPPANPPTPPAPPATPEIVTPPMVQSTAGKKEPEDIFSGLEKSSLPKGRVPDVAMEAPHAFPVKLIIGIVGGLLLVGGIGAAVYFFVVLPKMSTPATSSAPVAAPAPTRQVGIPSTSTPSSQPGVTSPATSSVAVEVPPPATQPPAGVAVPPPTPVESAPAPTPAPTPAPAVVTPGKDTDADGLTDAEEPYFNADPQKTDTDGDGFSDGSEVKNLYDPSVKGGTLDSAKYIAKTVWSGLEMLLPKPWSIVAEPGNGGASILTGSATKFDVMWVANPEKKSFDNLVAQDAGLPAEGGVVAGKHMTTKRGYAAIIIGDHVYVAIGDKVVKLTYDLNGDTMDQYRTSFEMVVQSLRLVSGS